MKSEFNDEYLNDPESAYLISRREKIRNTILRPENSTVYCDSILFRSTPGVKSKVESVEIILKGASGHKIFAYKYDYTKKSYFGRDETKDKSATPLPEDNEDCIYGTPDFFIYTSGLLLKRKKPSHKLVKGLWIFKDILEDAIFGTKESKSEKFRRYGAVISVKNDTSATEYITHAYPFLIENDGIGPDLFDLKKGRRSLPRECYLEKMYQLTEGFPGAGCNLQFYAHTSTESNSSVYPTHVIVDLYYRKAPSKPWVPVVDKKHRPVCLEFPITDRR